MVMIGSKSYVKHKSILELKTHNQCLPLYNYAFSACRVWVLAEAEIKSTQICMLKYCVSKNFALKKFKNKNIKICCFITAVIFQVHRATSHQVWYLFKSPITT